MGRLLRGRVCGARLHNGRELLIRARSFVLSLIQVTADPGDNHLNGHWRERSTMIGRTGTFGAAGLAWRHRRPAYVGWISIFVLAHDAICPDESKAKDPATPELTAPAQGALPEADAAAHSKDWQGQSSPTTGAQSGRGWQPEYDPNAPPGPYGGSVEETTSAPATSASGQVPTQPTCMTASGVAGPCLQPGVPYVAGTPRMSRGYARPYGVHRAQPRVMDNGGGGGRN
jgi:hypothetical protein